MKRRGKDGAISQFFLNPEKLIVFGYPVCPGGGAGFDLAGIGAHGQVCNGRILGLARAVGNDGSISGLFCHLDDFKSFRQCSDLIEFDQYGVSDAFLDSSQRRAGLVTKRSSPTS